MWQLLECDDEGKKELNKDPRTLASLVLDEMCFYEHEQGNDWRSRFEGEG